MDKLDLPLMSGQKLLINPSQFESIYRELELFLEDEKGICNLEFVKRILFNLEIKSNNTVEGINDDLSFIEDVIKNAGNISNNEKRNRIINLYNGYKYILENRNINEDSVRKLYNILSNGIIPKNYIDRMGKYYREDRVYILNKGRLDLELDEGIPFDEIKYYIDKYFAFASNSYNSTMTEEFIKSQIMHFYFVYIHPYFDVNGRTSRTIAMWDILNEKAYPYIIFNRAINFSDSSYDTIIREAKNIGNISYFIKYMMENVKVELEKEIIMREIKKSTTIKMTSTDFLALQYILSMKGEVNVLTFSSFYRNRNGIKPVKDIYFDILRPLIDKDILLVDRTCKKKMFSNYDNEVLKLNKTKFDVDNPKIKRLSIEGK